MQAAKLLPVLGLLALGACGEQIEASCQSIGACRSPLKPAIEADLYFGRGIDGGAEVSEADWARFVADEVTPRFPDGLSVFDVAGQYRDPTGEFVREKTKLLVVVVFDAPAHVLKVQSIANAYNSRFGQHSVFRVERPACAGA